MRGKELTCPECGGKLKRWMTTVVKDIAVQRTVMYVGSVIKMDLGGNKDVRYFRTRCI
jgi:predicted nucleic acid-binding Zn ribbon protein